MLPIVTLSGASREQEILSNNPSAEQTGRKALMKFLTQLEELLERLPDSFPSAFESISGKALSQTRAVS